GVAGVLRRGAVWEHLRSDRRSSRGGIDRKRLRAGGVLVSAGCPGVRRAGPGSGPHSTARDRWIGSNRTWPWRFLPVELLTRAAVPSSRRTTVTCTVTEVVSPAAVAVAASRRPSSQVSETDSG